MIAILMLMLFMMGFLSMGFQMVASRLLLPWFGSEITVWASLISTFLLAFSGGSMGGGWISRLPIKGNRIGLIAITAGVIFGYWLIALAHKPVLEGIYGLIDDERLGQFVACMCLFFIPVTALAAFSPLAAEYLSSKFDYEAGYSSGMVYGVSTFGNIAGVLGTAFFLIPSYVLSSLIFAWAVMASILGVAFAWLFWPREEKGAASEASS